MVQTEAPLAGCGGSKLGIPPTGARRHRALIAALALAGIIGPILFTVAFVTQGLFRLGEYDPVAETISALEAGPGGWVQQVNFVAFGLTTIAFASGLQLKLRPAAAGPTILMLSGLALLWAAAFPMREDASGVPLPPGLHLVGGFTYFSSAAIGLVVLSRRLARDAAWRDLAGYTLGAGIAGIAGFVAINVLVRPDDAPLHAWYGLAQRALLLAALFPPTIVLALRLFRLSRSGEAPGVSPATKEIASPSEEKTRMADPLRYPGTPRWVKLSGMAVGVLALLVLLIVWTGVGGLHGPSRHLSSSSVEGQGMQQP